MQATSILHHEFMAHLQNNLRQTGIVPLRSQSEVAKILHLHQQDVSEIEREAFDKISRNILGGMVKLPSDEKAQHALSDGSQATVVRARNEDVAPAVQPAPQPHHHPRRKPA